LRIEYDARADAAYIYVTDQIAPGAVAKTVPCDPAQAGLINLDFDADGRLLGIEVLDASRRLGPDLLRTAAPSATRNRS
jgi:uncharacterized protein YuzE